MKKWASLSNKQLRYYKIKKRKHRAVGLGSAKIPGESRGFDRPKEREWEKKRLGSRYGGCGLGLSGVWIGVAR